LLLGISSTAFAFRMRERAVSVGVLDRRRGGASSKTTAITAKKVLLALYVGQSLIGAAIGVDIGFRESPLDLGPGIHMISYWFAR
jgi:hypothetical protein